MSRSSRSKRPQQQELELGLPKARASAGRDSISGYGGYDAAGNSPARSALCFPTNSYNEFTSSTRCSIVQKVRALDANLPIFSRIHSKMAQHAVGKGIFVRPITRDTEWNELSRKMFEEWAGNPGVYSVDASRDHYEDQALIAETIPADGEFFEALLSNSGMVQPLDVFEVKTPWGGGMDFDPADYTDGVLTNRYGRPMSYAVQELSSGYASNSGFRNVAAQNMLHVWKRRRARQYRGLPWAYSGVNRGIDALDLQALITGTAKLHSGLAVTVKKNGKLGRKGAIDKIKAHGEGATPAEEDFRALERVYGGGMISYLGQEGEVNLLSSNYPGESKIEFLKFLYADIAMAYKVPLSVIYTLAPLGGASVRGELEDAQWLFDLLMDKIVCQHSFPIYRWRTAKFVKEGRLRPCKDPYWWTCSFRGPAKLTVDIGRTADANIALLKNGGLTYTRYYDERGLEAREELSDQVYLMKWLQDLCKQEGVDMNRIIEPAKLPTAPRPEQ